MSGHSPEPWVVRFSTVVYSKSGTTVAHVAVRGHGEALVSDEEVKANARRIVACVNACAGMSTEDLESGSCHPVIWDKLPIIPELYVHELPDIDLGEPGHE